MLGGPNSVLQHLDWLAATRIYIRSLLKLNRPVLGICLGAQQITKAFGANVYRLPLPQTGLGTVKDSDGTLLLVFTWHGTANSRLPGSQILYTKQHALQGFAYTQRIVGLQFTYTVTPANITAIGAVAHKPQAPVNTALLEPDSQVYTAILTRLFKTSTNIHTVSEL